jgi:opacity protein-like surface antigen
LADRWTLPYYLDVGTGDSDLTYQTSAGISYAAGESFNVVLLYRYLKWEFDSSSNFDNLSFEGPMLGGVYRF